IRSGEVCWSVDMEGGWRLVAAKGKVLVATPDFWPGRSELLIIDLTSGQKLLRHEAPPDVHWLQVYFDGTQVYLVDSGSSSLHTYDAKPEKLTALDLKGKIGSTVNYSSPEIKPKSTDRWNTTFIWGDKLFGPDGRVQSVNAREQTALVATWRQENPRWESRQ